MLNRVVINANGEKAKQKADFPGAGSAAPLLRLYAESQNASFEEGQRIDLLQYKLVTHATLDWRELQTILDHSNGYVNKLELTNDLAAMTGIRLLQAALGALRYKRYHGSWPGSLKDCVPQYLKEIPPDPFRHGEFIHYESSPPRVYSVGTAATYLPEKHAYSINSPTPWNKILLVKQENMVWFLEDERRDKQFVIHLTTAIR